MFYLFTSSARGFARIPCTAQSWLMPGFSNVRYRFYSDIDRLTAVLVLHERKIAHTFDKVSANLEDCDRSDIYSVS